MSKHKYVEISQQAKASKRKTFHLHSRVLANDASASTLSSVKGRKKRKENYRFQLLAKSARNDDYISVLNQSTSVNIRGDCTSTQVWSLLILLGHMVFCGDVITYTKVTDQGHDLQFHLPTPRQPWGSDQDKIKPSHKWKSHCSDTLLLPAGRSLVIMVVSALYDPDNRIWSIRAITMTITAK